jgi:hypothetical protein
MLFAVRAGHQPANNVLAGGELGERNFLLSYSPSGRGGVKLR